MDPTVIIKGAVEMVLGYAWQWTRSYKEIPNWIGYMVFGVVSAFGWLWMTPTLIADFQDDWRFALATTVFGLSSTVSAARGYAAMSKDTRIAKPTDSQ